MEDNAPGKREMTITRTFQVPRARVFEAWTNPEHLMHWWAPKTFTTPLCEVDLQVGGEFRYCMRSPEGKDFWGKGKYREIIVPEKIVYIDTFTDAGGTSVPPSFYGLSATEIEETLVTVVFEEEGPHTRMTLHTVSASSSQPEPDQAGVGWNEMFDNLAAYLGSKG